MRSRNDNIVVTFGIIVLLIALMGSAAFEGEEPEEVTNAYRVEFSMNAVIALDQNGHTNEGQTTEVPLEVGEEEYLNITSMDFQLTWNDDLQPPVGDPNDEFELTITHPEEMEEGPEYDPSPSESSDDEQIDITANILDIPENIDLEPGSSEEEISNKHISKVGIGTWMIEVSCNSAGDRDPTPYGQDDGNDWTLTVTINYYNATVMEIIIQTE